MTKSAPLEGVRVLDLSQLLPGPYATRVLLDMGATVDKLEPKAGDPARGMLPELFELLNAGKRSLVVDLKSVDGKAAFLRLLPQYDVVLEQFRPGVMARFGLSHETMLQANPHLVVCAITGYGQTGELSQRAGHDLNYLARAGVLAVQGPEGAIPATPGFQLADVGGALHATLQILAALFARERDPNRAGAFLDVAMADAAAPFALAQLALGDAFARGTAPLSGGIAVYNCYATKDGRYMALAALEPRFWLAFARGLGWAEDDAPCFPGPHQAEWKAKVTAVFATRTQAEWTAFGEAHDCCLEPVQSPSEATFKFPKGQGAVPKLGEHTEDVLAEVETK